MIPPQALGDFHALYSVEKHKIDDQISRDIGASIARSNAAGMLISSSSAIAILELTVRTLPIRAQVKLNILLRTLSAYGVTLDRETADEATSLIGKHLDDEVTQMTVKVMDTPVYKRPGLAPDPRIKLMQAAEEEKIRVRAELSLVVAASARSRSSEGSPVINISGPVGMIQTGPGAYGVSNQVVDSASSDALMRAFAVLEDLLKDQDNSSDVKELIEDGRQELKKAKPNMARLRGIISGVGGAVSYLPRLKEGYDTLKWAANLFGVALP